MALPDKLKICLIARYFPMRRQAESGFLWPIARGLAQKGHQVTIIAAQDSQSRDFLEQDQVNAHFIPATTTARAFAEQVYKKFDQLHRQNPFHLVHSLDNSAYRIAKRRQKLKVAVAFDVEATQMSQLFSILGMAQETLGSLLVTSIGVAYKFVRTFYGQDRSLLSNADGVFVTSPQQRIALERYYLYPDARTHTVPYGMEIGDLSPREKSDALRRELGLPQSSKIVVSVSDMSELREIRSLLQAFVRVAVKKPSARLIIVGYGPRYKEVEYEVLQLALGGRVILTGAVKNADLVDYISLADVFLNISSRTSGFEPSILEAMAQMKVIVGSEVSPISTIVEDGQDGFLVRPADVPAIARLLLQIFDNQLATEEMGERARRKILNLFDMEKMVNQTLEAYYRILHSTGYGRAQWKIW